MTSGGNNFNHFAENQLIKFNARDAGEFNDAVGEQEMAPKCGNVPQDAGDLLGLCARVLALFCRAVSSGTIHPPTHTHISIL